MKIYLYRKRIKGESTDGVLIDQRGNRICDTAENTLTMLPEGKYRLDLKKYKKGNYRAAFATPIDANGEKQQGWRGSGFIIHGNGVYGRGLGSNIIVGDYLVPGVVTHSAKHFTRLIKRLEKAEKRKTEVEIDVKVLRCEDVH